MFGSGSKKKKKEKRKALEVRARSKSLRALRLRLAWNALAISTGIVLVLLVVWKGGEELLRRYVYTSPSFALENLEIITDGIIPQEQIRRWSGVERGAIHPPREQPIRPARDRIGLVQAGRRTTKFSGKDRRSTGETAHSQHRSGWAFFEIFARKEKASP